MFRIGGQCLVRGRTARFIEASDFPVSRRNREFNWQYDYVVRYPDNSMEIVRASEVIILPDYVDDTEPRIGSVLGMFGGYHD